MAMAFAIVAAVGQLVQGREEANAMRDDAEVEKYRAAIAEQNARQAGQRASAEQERSRRASRQVLGEQRAAIAQTGTTVDFGSNVDIMRQSTTNAELDALNIQYAGEVERGNFMEEAKMRKYNQQALRQGARQKMRMRWLNALGAGMQAYGGAGGSMGGGGGNASSTAAGASGFGAGAYGSARGF